MGRRSDLSSLVRKSAIERQGEAERLRCDYVGAEHQFISLLRVGESNAVKILRRLGYDIDELIAAAEQEARPVEDPPESAHGLEVTIELLHAYRKMNEVAAQFGSETVGTEHLLLGLLSRTNGGKLTPLGRAMADKGLTFKKVESIVKNWDEEEIAE